MSRIDFMKALEALLQDISAEERKEAMQYYNDYFDDAGVENEPHIMSELGSPEKVAATIKAGLKGAAETSSQYGETGYTDTRFEEKEAPAVRNRQKRDGQKNSGQNHAKQADNQQEYGQQAKNQEDRDQREQNSGYSYSRNNSQSLWSDGPLKILLIIAIAIFGIPVFGIAISLAAAAAALAFAFLAVMVSLVIASLAIAISGIVVFFTGCVQLFIAVPVGLALIGVGLVLFVIGVIASVFSSKLCVVVIPAVFRAIVDLCRRPFRRRAVSA